MINLEELYQNYCAKIFDIGLDEIDFTNESFISEIIDMKLLLELKGWIKSGNILSFEEFSEKLNSDEIEYITDSGRFRFQAITFQEKWSVI